MKTIDFTKPGGFPLTQDRLDYLQTAYSECLGALAAAPGNGAPVKLSGMVETSSFFTSISVSDGWLFYNGAVVRFAASTFSAALGIGVALYVVITNTSATLPYYDTSNPAVVNEAVATLQYLSIGTPTDATHFPYSSLLSFGQAIGDAYRESTWKHIAVNTLAGSGTISGDIYYKKDNVANTLQLRGEVIATTGGDFAAWPSASSILMGVFGGGYRPANNVFFTVQAVEAGGVIGDINGTFFSRLNATLQTDGKLYIDWLKPDAGNPIYAMVFNLVVPLD